MSEGEASAKRTQQRKIIKEDSMNQHTPSKSMQHKENKILIPATFAARARLEKKSMNTEASKTKSIK